MGIRLSAVSAVEPGGLAPPVRSPPACRVGASAWTTTVSVSTSLRLPAGGGNEWPSDVLAVVASKRNADFGGGPPVFLPSGIRARHLRAASNKAGKDFARLDARRRIPRQAFALKKNLDGIGPFSKTCHKEQTLASLRHIRVLSVFHPPSCGPEGSVSHTRICPPSSLERTDDGGVVADKSAKEGAEGVVLGVKDVGDLLEQDVSNSVKSNKFMDQLHSEQGQVAA